MIIELLSREILSAILAADTYKALALIQDYQVIFSDPVNGLCIHAEALHSAIKKANIAVMQALLALPLNSDLNFFKFCGTTPISAAVEGGHEKLLPLLLAKTDKHFALYIASKLKLRKSLSFLLQHGFFKEVFLKMLKCDSIKKPEGPEKY